MVSGKHVGQSMRLHEGGGARPNKVLITTSDPPPADRARVPPFLMAFAPLVDLARSPGCRPIRTAPTGYQTFALIGIELAIEFSGYSMK